MNRYLEKIAAKIPKKLLRIANSNPFLENTKHVSKGIEKAVTSTSTIPGLKAMSRKEYSDFIRQVDANKPKKIKASIESKITPAKKKDRYAPLSSGAPYFSIKRKVKKS